MALTEIQKNWLTKTVLYQNLMNIATNLERQMNDLWHKLEWLDLITAQDLTDISIPTETQTKLANFRTALNSLKVEYETNVAAVVNSLRML